METIQEIIFQIGFGYYKINPIINFVVEWLFKTLIAYRAFNLFHSFMVDHVKSKLESGGNK